MNDLPWLKIVPLVEIDPTNLAFLYGVFKTKKAPPELVKRLANEFKLCHKLIGLEKGRGICFAHQLDKCTGVCVGKEKKELHHLRLKTALMLCKLKAWPYKGKAGIKELNRETNKTQLHIFEHWCYLKTLSYVGDLEDVSNTRYDLGFDIGVYNLIEKALLTSEVIELKNNQPDHSLYLLSDY